MRTPGGGPRAVSMIYGRPATRMSWKTSKDTETMLYGRCRGWPEEVAAGKDTLAFSPLSLAEHMGEYRRYVCAWRMVALAIESIYIQTQQKGRV